MYNEIKTSVNFRYHIHYSSATLKPFELGVGIKNMPYYKMFRIQWKAFMKLHYSIPRHVKGKNFQNSHF